MPLLLEEQSDEQSRLALWRLEESSEELLNLLPDHLEEEQLRMPIRNELLFRQRLASRLLLVHLFPGRRLKLGRNENKKTRLLDAPEQISISHAGSLAAVRVSACQPVGIDVEEVAERIGRISNRFINEQEWGCLQGQQDFRGMMLIWAVKEAVFKYAGQSGLDFKLEICMDSFRVDESGKLGISLKGQRPERLEVSYRFLGDYVLAFV